MKFRLLLLRFFLGASVAVFGTPASARPGDPDFRFNPSGTNSVPGSVQLGIPNADTSLIDFRILPDGKILTMGSANFNLVLCRFLPGGSLDPAFGTGGVALTPQGFAMSMGDMAVQTDGRIVVAGYPIEAVRFLADGTLDPSFGTDGKSVIHRPPESYNSIGSVVVLSDGKILLGGQVQSPASSLKLKPGLWRLLPDGSVDQSFGLAGSVALPLERATTFDMAVQPDGKVVMAGATPFPESPSQAWLARCDANGALDPSFGSAGIVVVPLFPGVTSTQASRLAIQNDGKLVIAGPVYGGKGRCFLARCHSNGSPDVSFGGDGHIVADVSPGADFPRALAVQRDGKIVLIGSAGDKLFLARHLPDGTLDHGFGNGGVVMPWTQTSSASGSAVVLQPDGRIVVGGTVDGAGDSKDILLLMRMDGDLPETLAGESPVGTALASGSTVKLQVLRGDHSTPETVITLQNTGSSPLINPVASLLGPGADRFLITSTLPPVLNSGATAAITVRFLPVPQVSSFDAVLWVDSGVPDFATFVVFLRGDTLLPVATLALFDGPQPVADNATVNLGRTLTSQPAVHVFTIKNTGIINLHLQGASLGTDGTPEDFSVGLPAAVELEPGASTTFPVTFTPSGPGERTARLRIASTDTLGLPYEITLTGGLAEGIEVWRITHFGSWLNEGLGADGADPDHDGLSNLMECATSTDPVAPNPSVGQLTLSGDTMEYTFTRPSDAVNYLRYSFEWANSLTDPWAETGTHPAVLSDDGVLQHVKFTLPAGPTGRRFVRLRVGIK